MTDAEAERFVWKSILHTIETLDRVAHGARESHSLLEVDLERVTRAKAKALRILQDYAEAKRA